MPVRAAGRPASITGRCPGGCIRPCRLVRRGLHSRDGIPWPVEINPRYTASLEVRAGRAVGRCCWQSTERASRPPPRLRLRSDARRRLSHREMDPCTAPGNWLPRKSFQRRITGTIPFAVRSIADIPSQELCIQPRRPRDDADGRAGAGPADCRSRMLQLDKCGRSGWESSTA